MWRNIDEWERMYAETGNSINEVGERWIHQDKERDREWVRNAVVVRRKRRRRRRNNSLDRHKPFISDRDFLSFSNMTLWAIYFHSSLVIRDPLEISSPLSEDRILLEGFFLFCKTTYVNNQDQMRIFFFCLFFFFYIRVHLSRKWSWLVFRYVRGTRTTNAATVSPSFSSHFSERFNHWMKKNQRVRGKNSAFCARK